MCKRKKHLNPPIFSSETIMGQLMWESLEAARQIHALHPDLGIKLVVDGHDAWMEVEENGVWHRLYPPGTTLAGLPLESASDT
jgi:hypothetical protein